MGFKYRTRTRCGFGGHGSKLLEGSAPSKGAVLGVRRHSKAYDAVLEYRRVPLAQRGRKSGLVRDMLTRCLAPGARHAADGPAGAHACVPHRSVGLGWSTDGVDAMNLARQRNLRQGRHQSQTLCAVYDGVTSALGADALAVWRTTPMTSCGRGHPPTPGSGASARKTGASVRAPPAGRPTQELAGDRPKERRAQTQELDKQAVTFFYTVGTLVFILDFVGYVSEVARGRGTYVGGSVGLVYRVLIILSLALVL